MNYLPIQYTKQTDMETKRDQLYSNYTFILETKISLRCYVRNARFAISP